MADVANSNPGTPAMEGSKDTEFVNAKAYLLSSSTKTGMNL